MSNYFNNKETCMLKPDDVTDQICFIQTKKEKSYFNLTAKTHRRRQYLRCVIYKYVEIDKLFGKERDERKTVNIEKAESCKFDMRDNGKAYKRHIHKRLNIFGTTETVRGFADILILPCTN